MTVFFKVYSSDKSSGVLTKIHIPCPYLSSIKLKFMETCLGIYIVNKHLGDSYTFWSKGGKLLFWR